MSVSWSQPYPWALVVAFCAALAIWGHDPKRQVVHWLFKPLTTGVIFTVAFLMIPQTSGRGWALAALLFSLAGDVTLMFNKRLLPLGLLFFLAALVSYGTAFTLQLPLAPRQLVYLILPAAVGLLIIQHLWRHLGRLRFPVAIYVSALIFLAWRAFARFDAPEISLSAWWWGCLGSVFFMTGDALLAWRRFAKKNVPYWLELGTYYLAQWCLVISLT
jgi:uncharacterized membrane protein YhhN